MSMLQNMGGGGGTQNAAGNWGNFLNAEGARQKSTAATGLTNAQKYVADMQQRRQAELAQQATGLQNQIGEARGQRAKSQQDTLMQLLQLQSGLKGAAIGNAGQLLAQQESAGMYGGKVQAQDIANQQAASNLKWSNIQNALGAQMTQGQLDQMKAAAGGKGDFFQIAPGDQIGLLDHMMDPFKDPTTGNLKAGVNKQDILNSVIEQMSGTFNKTKQGLLTRVVKSWVESWYNGGGKLPDPNPAANPNTNLQSSLNGDIWPTDPNTGVPIGPDVPGSGDWWQSAAGQPQWVQDWSNKVNLLKTKARHSK
jgi:hypothetical protein